MYQVDLNCDLGESFGAYRIGMDEQIIPLISSANIACGFHASDPVVMEEVKALIIYQIGALSAFVKAQGGTLQHVKPHGALYNMAGKDEKLAIAICEGIKAVEERLIVLGQPGSKMEAAAAACKLPFAREVFADRAYEEDGSLVARSKEGAMITDEDEAVSRVIRMIKEQKVTAITGKDIPITADSVCVHGDGVKALKFVEKIKKALQEEGISVVPLGEML